MAHASLAKATRVRRCSRHGPPRARHGSPNANGATGHATGAPRSAMYARGCASHAPLKAGEVACVTPGARSLPKRAYGMATDAR